MSDIVLVLAGTNEVLASYDAEYIPCLNSIIEIEDPGCSAGESGFSYKKYRVKTHPRISIQRHSVDTNRNNQFYQRVLIDIEPVNSKVSSDCQSYEA